MNKIVVGMGFGDEGKGTAVDYFTDNATKTYFPSDVVNVRFCGGHQAGHRVVLPSGHSHIFSQFGSGTFHGVKTLHDRNSIVEPLAMRREYEALKNFVNFKDVMRIHPKCLVTTPLQKYMDFHDGYLSCGVGVGKTKEYFLKYGNDAIFYGDSVQDKLDKLHLMKERYIDSFYSYSGTYEILEKLISFNPWSWCGETLEMFEAPYEEHFRCYIFEGTQGFGLDEVYGIIPYTTWSSVTPRYALDFCKVRGITAEIVGVIRTFFSRHGDGPFNQSEVGIKLNDDHNRYNKNQGPIKYGTFGDNLRIFQNAERVVKPDGIFLTWCDKKPKGFSESLISSPIKWKSYGTTYKDKTTVL